MAKPREELQELFEQLLGSRNVYFQPPESLMLQYPCVVYERSNYRMDFADNAPYLDRKCYKVTVIDEDPESEIPDKVARLPYCGFSSHFATDGLNHDVYNLFF